jgi:hypothetical protein
MSDSNMGTRAKRLIWAVPGFAAALFAWCAPLGAPGVRRPAVATGTRRRQPLVRIKTIRNLGSASSAHGMPQDPSRSTSAFRRPLKESSRTGFLDYRHKNAIV